MELNGHDIKNAASSETPNLQADIPTVQMHSGATTVSTKSQIILDLLMIEFTDFEKTLSDMGVDVISSNADIGMVYANITMDEITQLMVNMTGIKSISFADDAKPYKDIFQLDETDVEKAYGDIVGEESAMDIHTNVLKFLLEK